MRVEGNGAERRRAGSRAASLLACIGWLGMAAGGGLLPAARAEAGEPIPVEKFFERFQFNDIELSPTGEYLAATVPFVDRTALVILRRSDLQRTTYAAFGPKLHVAQFYWVNPSRVVYTVGQQEGSLARPYLTGVLYGLDVDGRHRGVISENPGEIYDTLRNDDNYVQVQYSTDTGRTGIGRLHVYSGASTMVDMLSPIQNASFITDNASKVRFAIGRKRSESTSRLFRYNEGGDPRWEEVHSEGTTGTWASVAGFSADNNIAYMVSEETSGPDSLYTYDMRTGARTRVFRDDNVDLRSLLSSPVDGSIYGVRLLDGRPRTVYLDDRNPFAVSLQQMAAAFPGYDVAPVSYTDDGSLAIYRVASDVQPGEYYLLDRKAGKATFLTARADLPADALSPTEPVKFKARDGLEIEGFLTAPKASAHRDLPLVIYPHGGPNGIYDTWGYDPEVQLLASRGFAVLQVNYRGSGNYGRAFREKGFRQWGKAMQDDLTDATRWAIAQGIADPSRICIYGASYGGYAAMMGPIREPGLYRCAIGYVGVYDMPMVRRQDTHAGSVAREVFDAEIGPEAELLSPNRMAAQIKVPVLLGAGEEDQTAPPAHTKAMRDALRGAGVPVEAVFYPHEGHGNYLQENQVDWANRVLAFLQQHIGAGASAAKAAPAATAAPAGAASAP